MTNNKQTKIGQTRAIYNKKKHYKNTLTGQTDRYIKKLAAKKVAYSNQVFIVKTFFIIVLHY